MPEPRLQTQINRFLWVLAGLTVAIILISFPAWLDAGDFFAIPLIEGMPAFSAPFDYVFPVALCVFSILSATKFRKPYFHVICLGIILYFVFTDVNRLHPWLYQIGFIHLFFVLLPAERNGKTLVFLLQVMMAAIYFWSGIHKMNPAFSDFILPWMVEPFFQMEPLGEVGYLFAIAELLIGPLLLFTRTRVFGLVGVLGLHLFILLCIGPLGHNWNAVVWPWNFAMPLWAFVLFYKSGAALPDFSALRSKVAIGVGVVLLLFLPGLHSVNLVNGYLAFSMYSGKISRFEIYVSPEETALLPPTALTLSELDMGKTVILPDFWSAAERGITTFPSEWSHLRFWKKFCETFPELSNPNLAVYTTDGFTGETVIYNCSGSVVDRW